MKKTDPVYLLTWYGIPLAVWVLLVVIGGLVSSHLFSLFFAIGMMGYILLCVIVLPNCFQSRMEKNAQIMEQTFPQRGFTYQYKFTAHDAVFYIDTAGQMGVVWRNNPTLFQLADLRGLSDIRAHDGQQFNGTSLVSCRFRLDGKKYKIVTLRVSNGQLSMRDRKVTEAVAKAQELCRILQTAQQNALSKGGTT